MLLHIAGVCLCAILLTGMACGCGGRAGGGGQDAATDFDAGADAGGRAHPSQSLTSGGGSVSSANYRIELFIAPVRPVGSVSSPNYRIKLGPASARPSQ
jgi:hypothetical protein